MKVKPSFAHYLKIMIITFVVTVALLVGCFYWLFFTDDWGVKQIVVISAFACLLFALFLFGYFTNYYTVEKKYFVVKKFTQELTYYYADIIYIDEEKSEKSSTITFVTKFGHVKYLAKDKDNVLYRAMKQQCKNLISYQELRIKHPNIKI